MGRQNPDGKVSVIILSLASLQAKLGKKLLTAIMAIIKYQNLFCECQQQQPTKISSNLWCWMQTLRIKKLLQNLNRYVVQLCNLSKLPACARKCMDKSRGWSPPSKKAFIGIRIKRSTGQRKRRCHTDYFSQEGERRSLVFAKWRRLCVQKL